MQTERSLTLKSYQCSFTISVPLNGNSFMSVLRPKPLNADSLKLFKTSAKHQTLGISLLVIFIKVFIALFFPKTSASPNASVTRL